VTGQLLAADFQEKPYKLAISINLPPFSSSGRHIKIRLADLICCFSAAICHWC